VGRGRKQVPGYAECVFSAQSRAQAPLNYRCSISPDAETDVDVASIP
jgi:hypothetical protein